jgi:Tfp pilus assembly major pilin PilA
MQQGAMVRRGQNGLSLFGFIFVIAIIAVAAILGLRVVPTVVEYSAIKKAIVTAKNAGSTPREIQSSFDKQRDAGYIESVSGQDLEITRTGDGINVSVAYQKKIGLFGPVSLVIDYAASTASSAGRKLE